MTHKRNINRTELILAHHVAIAEYTLKTLAKALLLKQATKKDQYASIPKWNASEMSSSSRMSSPPFWLSVFVVVLARTLAETRGDGPLHQTRGANVSTVFRKLALSEHTETMHAATFPPSPASTYVYISVLHSLPVLFPSRTEDFPLARPGEHLRCR